MNIWMLCPISFVVPSPPRSKVLSMDSEREKSNSLNNKVRNPLLSLSAFTYRGSFQELRVTK